MVACSTYKSFAFMADAEKGMWNACGNLGGLKSCLFTVAPGCWVTSTSDSSSVACGVTSTAAFCSLTVPLTAVAAGAGVPGPDAEAAALADELLSEELDAPQPASANVARNSGATASFCMEVPRKMELARRMMTRHDPDPRART